MPLRQPNIFTVFRLTVMLFSIPLFSACGPIFETYHYATLEAYKDAKVVERTKAQPGDYHWFVGKIPTHYVIRRDSYTLHLEVDPEWWGPGIRMYFEPYRPTVVDLEYAKKWYSEKCGSWRTGRPSYHREWFFGPTCRGSQLNTEYLMYFRVLDGDGKVIGEESIPYVIKQRGFYMYLDAI